MTITSLFINITKKSKLLFRESQTSITKKSGSKKAEDFNKKSNDLAKEKEIDKYYKLTVEDKEKIINEINEMLKK